MDYVAHESLSRVATCRMCLVDVVDAGNGKAISKLQTACSTPIVEGMKVVTNNDKVKTARHSIMEFLLVNHPLDCAICDQSGECDLQDLTFEYGTGQSIVQHILEFSGSQWCRKINNYEDTQWLFEPNKWYSFSR